MGGRGSSSGMTRSSESRSGGSNRSVYDSVRSTLQRGEAPTRRMITNAGVGSEISLSETSVNGANRVVTYTKISGRQWQLSPSRMPVQDRYSNTIVASQLYYAFTGKYGHADNVRKIKIV